MKALRTHESEAGPKPRAMSIRGSATFTTVASRVNMSWATRTIAIPAAARPAFAGRSAGRVCAWPGEVVEVM